MPANKPAPAFAKPFPKKTPASDVGKSASQLIDARIAELGDWRGVLLGRIRQVIVAAAPGVTEEWKWNVPVWSCGGIICTGETYQKAVKLTFAKGASLPDPSSIFNSSLDGKVRRAIDFPQACQVDEAALKALVREAIALNKSLPLGKARRPA